MKVRFFSGFTKAVNSTKRPTTQTPYVEIDGEIKGDFSPLSPVIRFSSTNFPATTTPEYVYCYIASFKRVYFVEWAFVSGFWEAAMTCDVLGTYRGTIRSSTQFVERSASAADQYLMDSACVPTFNVSTALAAVSQSSIWGADFAVGTFVVGIVAGADLTGLSKNVGSVRYYAMSQTGFGALMYALLHSPAWMNISTSEISEDLQKALVNPAQYIVSAIWLPINATEFIGSSQDQQIAGDITQVIKLGWWDFDIQTDCRILHNPTSALDSWSKWVSFTYTEHPDTNTFGRWVNFSPYTQVTLDFPPFGTIDLDTTLLNSAAQTPSVSVHVFVQAYTGDATAYVFAGAANPQEPEPYPTSMIYLGSLHGNVGVQIPIGQIAVNIANYKNAVVAGTVTGAAELINAMKEG